VEGITVSVPIVEGEVPARADVPVLSWAHRRPSPRPGP
jgi:hypothetical protein